MQHVACKIVGSCCSMLSRVGQTNVTLGPFIRGKISRVSRELSHLYGHSLSKELVRGLGKPRTPFIRAVRGLHKPRIVYSAAYFPPYKRPYCATWWPNARNTLSATMLHQHVASVWPGLQARSWRTIFKALNWRFVIQSDVKLCGDSWHIARSSDKGPMSAWPCLGLGGATGGVGWVGGGGGVLVCFATKPDYASPELV